MNPTEWGPAGWKFLHSITFAQPEKPNAQQSQHIRNFFNALGHLLPCQKCARHYLEFLSENPVPTGSRDSLTRWLVRLHNNANRATRERMPVKLPEFRYEDAVRVYAYPDGDVIPNPVDSTRAHPAIVTISVAVVVALVLGCLLLLVHACTGGRKCPIN